MNQSRRGFLARALGLGVGAPALTRLIAKGGEKPTPPPRFKISSASFPTVTASVIAHANGKSYLISELNSIYPPFPNP